MDRNLSLSLYDSRRGADDAAIRKRRPFKSKVLHRHSDRVDTKARKELLDYSHFVSPPSL